MSRSISQTVIYNSEQEQRRQQLRRWLQQLEAQPRGLKAGRQRTSRTRSRRRLLMLFFNAAALIVALSLLQEFFF